MPDYLKILAKNLIFYRHLRGYTQQKVQDLTKIPSSAISKFESGNGNSPTVDTLEKFAQAYRCTVSDLLKDRSAPIDAASPGNKVKESEPNYGDPELNEICRLIKNNPQLKTFILKELKLLNSEGPAGMGEILEAIINLPPHKRLGLLNFIRG